MFAVLTHSVSRRLVVRSVRCASSLPPLRPSSDSEPANNTPANPATPSPTSLLPSLDFSPPEPEPETQRTGAKSSKDTLSTAERRRQIMGRTSLALLFLGLGLTTAYMGRDWSEDELKKKKLRIEDAPSTWLGRTKERFSDIFDYFNKPLWPELLPPPLPAPHHKPYTILLSIDDLLVTSTWDRQHGWRTAKRPGVDYFLGYISQFYEVVIFTTQHHYTAIPILEKLDPYNFFINYRLFREATRSINGKIVKDLSYLNRDLSKVISIDTDEDHVSTHLENAIILPKWKGDPHDKGLIAMIPFLESIGIYKPEDVRPILNAYRGKDIPLEYAKKEAEAKQKHIEEWQYSKKGIVSGGFTLSGLFGSSSNSHSTSPIPPTYLEQKRKEAQQQYKDEQAYIQAHKGEFEKIIEQDQKAMAKEAPNNLWEAFRAMNGMTKTNTDVNTSQGAGSSEPNSTVQPS